MSNRTCRAVGSLLTLLLLTPVPAGAQAPHQRSALDAWRDSLSTISDTVRLLELERAGIERAKADREDPMQHLRLGFLALRLGAVGGKSHYDDAAGEFEWAGELAPSWPYVWLGLGLAERALARPQGNLLYGVMAWLGRDQRTVAASEFAKAVDADPGFFPALEALQETSGEQRLNQRLEITLGAFRRAAGTVAADEVRYYLYRGRLERQVGDIDSAEAAFERYLELGGARGLGRLELARTRFLLPRGDGSESYYRGTDVAEADGVAEYRKDLMPIADSVELAAFDETRGPARRAFLRDFWTSRDDADLRRRGARLEEHYRRLGFARREFPAPPFLRRLNFGDYYTNETDFDDRGVIYVRHGEPSVRKHIVNPTAQVYGAEIWRYERADGPMVFYFLADARPEVNGDLHDYRLRATPLDLPLRGDEDLQSVVSGLVTANVAAPRFAQEAFIRGKHDIAVGTTTDSYELRFDEPIEGRVQAAVGGSRPGGSFLHVAYAVPVEEVEADSTGAVVLTVRVVVFDHGGTPVVRVDSSATWAPEDSAGVRTLLGRVSAPVPVGSLTYRVAIVNGTRGGLFPTDSVRVRPPGQGPLALGEPVLGSRRLGLGWARPASPDTVFFNPLLTFPPEGDLELYYEVFGMAPGRTYATDVEVKKEGGGILRSIFGGGKRIQLSYSETAARPEVRANRTIRLADLDPGEYTLTLTVTGPEGQSVRQEQRFQVRR